MFQRLSLETFFLSLHILDNNIIDVTDRLTIFKNQPWLIGMKVNLDRITITTYCQKAVTLEVLQNLIMYFIFIEIFTIDEKLCIKLEFQFFHKTLHYYCSLYIIF